MNTSSALARPGVNVPTLPTITGDLGLETFIICKPPSPSATKA